MHNVFLFGDINLDISMPVPEIPPPGQDVYLDQLLLNLGGSSTNTCITLSQLGLRTRLFGSVGTDPNADYLLKRLTSFGIDTSSILRKTTCPSGHIFLTILPDGERTMYSYRGANTLTSTGDIPADWKTGTDLLHLSGYTFLMSPQRDTALALIVDATENSIPVSMDTGMDPVLIAHSLMKKILDRLDICICGVREGTVLTGQERPEEIIQTIFDLGVSCVSIKLGDQGCVVGFNGEIIHMPSLSIQVADTTGSGDAFSAGILYAWLNHLSLPDMCTLANGLGAYKATQPGSNSAQLNWQSLLSFINDVRNDQSIELQQAIDHLQASLSFLSDNS